MRILFYAPFKPLDHAHPSGDLVTATEIVDYLIKKGHQVVAASSLRCRWIYWKPWLWPKLIIDRQTQTCRKRERNVAVDHTASTGQVELSRQAIEWHRLL